MGNVGVIVNHGIDFRDYGLCVQLREPETGFSQVTFEVEHANFWWNQLGRKPLMELAYGNANDLLNFPMVNEALKEMPPQKPTQPVRRMTSG